MTTNDILIAADQGAEPVGLDPAERLLWCRMREVYRAFRAGEISKGIGQDCKTAALAEYRQASNRLRQGTEAQRRMAWIWQELERYSSAYRKERSLDTADALMQAVYGLQERRADA